VLFQLPKATYDRFELRSGNKQSQLLQEIKTELASSFPKTDIRGDGPVVKIPFQTFAVELVPGFKLDTGRYYIPITTNGGSYKTFDPDAEYEYVKNSNTTTKENTRELIRMMKCWQSYCSVPLKSFYIEILAVEFLKQWKYAGNSKTYYDWIVRDFLEYLIKQANTYICVPGTYELIYLGEAWKSRAQTALGRAKEACANESEGYTAAGADGRATQGSDHLGLLFWSLHPSSREPRYAGHYGGRCRPSVVRLPGQGQVDLFRRCFFQRRTPASQKSERRVCCCARACAEARTARALRVVESPNGRRRKRAAVADCATINDRTPSPRRHTAISRGRRPIELSCWRSSTSRPPGARTDRSRRHIEPALGGPDVGEAGSFRQ
jgi:hypothetical protein